MTGCAILDTSKHKLIVYTISSKLGCELIFQMLSVENCFLCFEIGAQRRCPTSILHFLEQVSTNLLSLPLLYWVGGLFIVAFNILGDIKKNFPPGFDLRSAVDIRSI
jgi:hypothetical protein